MNPIRIGQTLHFRREDFIVRPAIVVEVRESTLLLAVFEPFATPAGLHLIESQEADEDGENPGWFWPPEARTGLAVFDTEIPPDGLLPPEVEALPMGEPAPENHDNLTPEIVPE